MALRKVSIPTLRNQVGILTLRRAILEWYRFLLCAEQIYKVLSVTLIAIVNVLKCQCSTSNDSTCSHVPL